MPQNFIESRRGQGFLLPPDLRDWVPGDHLAWFVIDAVKEMDLDAFYGAYRADGHGRAAYELSVMVTLILYAFATGVELLTDTLDGDDDAIVDGDRVDERPNDQRVESGNGWQ